MTTDRGRNGQGWRIVAWGGAAIVLLLPLVAMGLGAPGVHWTGSDFAVMGLLLAVACGAWELGMRLSPNRAYRAGVALAALTGLLLVWVNLAVGFIGDTGNPANLLFAGVLAIAACGTLLARFRAGGIARALGAAAVAQAVVGVVALGVHRVGVVETIASAVFVALWLASAALFRRAARQAP